MRTATASYKNVKNYALHVKGLHTCTHKTLLYTVHPVSMGFGALLKESIQTTCRRCRQRNHPFDNSRFDVVTKDTVPTHLRPCSSPLLVGNVDGIIIPGHRRMLDGRMSTVAGCSTHQHRCNQMLFYYSCFDRSRRFFRGGVTGISTTHFSHVGHVSTVVFVYLMWYTKRSCVVKFGARSNTL